VGGREAFCSEREGSIGLTAISNLKTGKKRGSDVGEGRPPKGRRDEKGSLEVQFR